MSEPKSEIKLQLNAGTIPEPKLKVAPALVIGAVGLTVGVANLAMGIRNAVITPQRFAELKGMLQQIQVGIGHLQRNIEVNCLE